nr:glycosyltransferase [Actinomycetota bacterium]
YLAITGNTWFQSVERSPYAHWRPKMVHVDLAVDRVDFPRVKTRFAAPGSRSFVYIGHSGWYKNTGYLSEIAALAPELDIGWIGSGPSAIRGLTALGRRDFSTEEGKALVAGYDFLLTVGSADANPTTVLEAMAWGLIPVCTAESGYSGYPGIVNLPLGDARAAAAILTEIQRLPSSALEEMRRENDAALDQHFTWERFGAQVVGAIESDASPPCRPEPLLRLLLLRWAGLRSPYSPLRPPGLRLAARGLLAAVGLRRPAR